MRLAAVISLALLGGINGTARSEISEYLSDRQDLMVHVSQGWGKLGINCAAHAPEQTGQRLRIKDQRFAAGLGHHAPGEIIVDLSGQFIRFEAQVGVQMMPGSVGSVVFQVFVDDAKTFDSGVIRSSDPPRPVSVPLAGAQEMRLVVTDAGDGITCDCANWADARLVRDPAAKPTAEQDKIDVARFARVVTGDPGHLTGAQNSRVEEFSADDLYLDTDLYPDDQGRYLVPTDADGRGAIGLRWIERRQVRSLAIEFAQPPPARLAEWTEVQYWIGKSPYQGRWKSLNGTLVAQGDRWTFRVDAKENPALRSGTWKIRWVLSTEGQPISVRRLQAFTASVVRTADLVLQFEPAGEGRQVELEMYNGEFVEPADFAGQTQARVAAAESVPVKVRYVDRRSWQSDRAVLRIRLPEGAFAVGLDDVLNNKVVYVPAHQALVSLADANVNLADYRMKVADRQTILQEVRRLPDQTLAQAIGKLHREEQNRQPIMLSLACDNNKYIVHRDGAVGFALLDDPDDFVPPNKGTYPCLFRPICGSGKNEKITRHLDGQWYPIPIITIEDGGVVYRQSDFVVPYDRQASTGDNPWLNPQPLFVAAMTVENKASQPAEATLRFEFFSDADGNKRPADVQISGRRATARVDTRLMAAIEVDPAGTLKLSAQGGVLTLTGSLAAGQKVECAVYLPGWKISPDDHASLTGGLTLLPDCKAYWDRVMAGAMQVQVPDELLADLIKASQVHCLLVARNEAGGRRVAPWIASVSYGPLESESNSIIRGMGFFGHDEFTRRSLDFFIHRYDPAGFLTTGYTLMGTGWHLWTLGEHYRLARDADWLKGVAAQVAKCCSWVMKQREKTTRPDARGRQSFEAGLMPPGVMADWDVFAFYMYLNGVHSAGLRDAGQALADIGTPGADAFISDAQAFREDILRAYRATQAISPVLKLRNGTFVPPYPNQLLPGPTALFFPGEDGNRSWCYDVELGAHHLVPFGILPPDSAEVGWMMDHMEDVQFISDGWFDYPAAENDKDPFNFGGFAKVQPYYARNAEVCAMGDDIKPFVRSYFNTIPSLLGMETLSFQEHFRGVGAWNKTHETGYFLHQTRLMLLMERGQDLWLTPLVTNNWLKDGSVIAVTNAPTFYGPVSYRIASHVNAGRIDATIEPPTRSQPRAIVLRLRHPEGQPIRKVTVDDRNHTDFDTAKECIRIQPTTQTIRVQAEY